MATSQSQAPLDLDVQSHMEDAMQSELPVQLETQSQLPQDLEEAMEDGPEEPNTPVFRNPPPSQYEDFEQDLGQQGSAKPFLRLSSEPSRAPVPHMDTPRPKFTAPVFSSTPEPELRRRKSDSDALMGRYSPAMSSPMRLPPPVQEEEDLVKVHGNPNVTPIPKPEAALIFAAIMSACMFMGTFCVARWFFWEDDGFVLVPVILISIGGALDNYRLYRGTVLGREGLSTKLTTTTYLLEFSAIPLLWIAIAEVFSYQTGWWLVPLVARVLAVTCCVNGFNAFLSGPQGHYTISCDGGVWRHALDPFEVPFSLMIQPVLVAVAGLFLGFLSLCIYGDGASFLVQVLAFAGQALATREPIRGQFVSNALEFIYVGSLIYMYIIQI